MSNLRRAIPLVREICTKTVRSELRRGFHTTICTKAKAASPRLRVSKNERSPEPKQRATLLESLPPLVLLNAAHSAGALSVKPASCMEFLRVYCGSSGNHMTIPQLQELCDSFGLSPLNVAVLASILNRCRSPAQVTLGQKLLFSASELGERSATYEIIYTALATHQLHLCEAPLRRLGYLAKTEQDPRAMLLLGRVMLGRKDNTEALGWLQKATRPPTGSLEFDGAADALVQEGRILHAQGALMGSRKAFEKAALELDDPVAYFYLSKLEEFGSKNQEIYLMKASTGGILEAWHNLGGLELAKETNKKIQNIDDYGAAREWFLVAAAEGFGLSMLNLALMHKSVDDLDGAAEWLEKAMGVESVAHEAAEVRRRWEKEGMKVVERS